MQTVGFLLNASIHCFWPPQQGQKHRWQGAQVPWYEDPEYYTETYGTEGLFGMLTVILVIIASRVEPKDAGADTSSI